MTDLGPFRYNRVSIRVVLQFNVLVSLPHNDGGTGDGFEVTLLIILLLYVVSDSPGGEGGREREGGRMVAREGGREGGRREGGREGGRREGMTGGEDNEKETMSVSF